MNKIVNRLKESFYVLYDDEKYCVVKNCETKNYSFGLWQDFYDTYYFPVNQSCLTLKQIRQRLEAFTEINKKYMSANEQLDCWLLKQNLVYKNMLESLANE